MSKVRLLALSKNCYRSTATDNSFSAVYEHDLFLVLGNDILTFYCSLVIVFDSLKTG